MYVLVTVEPAGVVAKPRVKESEFVLFNIGKRLIVFSVVIWLFLN